MSQWKKGKPHLHKPPPALFLHASAAASSVSIPGAGEGTSHGGLLSPGSGGGGSSSGNSRTSNSPTNGKGSTGESGGWGVISGGGVGSLSPFSSAFSRLHRNATRLQQGASAHNANVLAADPAKAAIATKQPGTAVRAPASSSSVRPDKGGGTEPTTGSAGDGGGGGGAATAAAAAATGAAFSLPLPQLRHAPTRTTDRTDALWAEMQATLEEVELSASEGTRVFGADHDQKLAALRQAQIALAQAWARGEVEGGEESVDGGGGGGDSGGGKEREASHGGLLKAATVTTAVTSVSGGGGGGGGFGGSGSGDPSATLMGSGGAALGGARSNLGDSTAGSAAAAGMGAAGSVGGTTRAGSTVGGGGGAAGGAAHISHQDEQETQVDILMARKRREANDRYFERVSRGVLDVVAKLEDVARAMRSVEQESRGIWGGDNESSDQASEPVA